MGIKYDANTRANCLSLPHDYMYLHKALDLLGTSLISHYQRLDLSGIDDLEIYQRLFDDFDDIGFKQASHLLMSLLITERITAYRDIESFSISQNYKAEQVNVDFWIDERSDFEQIHDEIFDSGCCKGCGNNSEDLYYTIKKKELDWIIFDYQAIYSFDDLQYDNCYPPLDEYDYFQRTGDVLDKNKDYYRERYPEISFEDFKQSAPPPFETIPDFPISDFQDKKEQTNYIPPYIAFMQEMVLHFKLSANKPSPKKDAMIQKIIELRPKSLKLSKTQAGHIATFLRKPAEQDGGARRQTKKK